MKQIKAGNVLKVNTVLKRKLEKPNYFCNSAFSKHLQMQHSALPVPTKQAKSQ